MEGLNLGADDYLAKPFFMSELIARLQSVFRRSAANGSQTLEIDDLKVDLMTRQVTRAGKEIVLSPREHNLLVYLMRSPGRVFTRTQILEQVWEYHFDPGSNLVDSCVRRLRQKVDQGFESPLIETIRGVGLPLEQLRLRRILKLSGVIPFSFRLKLGSLGSIALWCCFC